MHNNNKKSEKSAAARAPILPVGKGRCFFLGCLRSVSTSNKSDKIAILDVHRLKIKNAGISTNHAFKSYCFVTISGIKIKIFLRQRKTCINLKKSPTFFLRLGKSSISLFIF